MKVSSLICTRISAIFICTIGLVNCAINAPYETTIPVSWSSGFTMPAMLESSKISLSNISDLSELMCAPW